VELSFIKDKDEAVAHFRRKRAEGGKQAVAAQYGLILALTQAGEFAEAKQLLRPMRDFAPTNMVYGLAEADIDIEQKNYDVAIAMLKRGLRLVPDNHAITMYLARAYVGAGEYAIADTLLSNHSVSNPGDAHLWYVLSEVQGKAGNVYGLHQSRAEYFALNGAMKEAIGQLNLARPLAPDNVAQQRIDTRITHFQNIAAELKKL
jgi:predicted Zn-dependent protease